MVKYHRESWQVVSKGFISIGIPILWIIGEIMSQGPQVADMECQETT
jgi:hypothetical protein